MPRKHLLSHPELARPGRTVAFGLVLQRWPQQEAVIAESDVRPDIY